MKNKELTINFIYATQNEEVEQQYDNWINNIFSLFEAFIVSYLSARIKCYKQNLEDSSNLSNLEQNRALTIVLITDDMVGFEEDFSQVKTIIIPIIINERKLKEYLEVYASYPTYNLSEHTIYLYATTHIGEKLLENRADNSILNFISHITDRWMMVLKELEVTYSKKETVLLGTVHPSLQDYRLQIQMYLEKSGYKVNVFSTNNTQQEERNEIFHKACQEHDVVIHLLNEYTKRYDHDNFSIMDEELNKVVEHITSRSNAKFHGFCWIIPDLEISQSVHLKNIIDHVQSTSANSANFHSYQMTIEEFKHLLISRLEYFYADVEIQDDNERSSLLIYDHKDEAQGDQLYEKISFDYDNLLTYKDLRKNHENIFYDYSMMSKFDSIIVYVEHVEKEWFQALYKHLLKVIQYKNEKEKLNEIRIISALKSKHLSVKDAKDFGFRLEYLNDE